MRTHLILAAALATAAACSGGDRHATTDSAGGEAAARDTSVLGPKVGTEKPVMDSAIARSNATIDSLKAAGETPATGIAKGIQPAAHASNNDRSPGSHALKVKPTNVP